MGPLHGVFVLTLRFYSGVVAETFCPAVTLPVI